MVTTDIVKTVGDLENRELPPNISLEVCQLGVVESTLNQRERVMVLKFADDNGGEVVMGVFVPESEEEKFSEWMGNGQFKSVSFGELGEEKKARLKQFSGLNLAPAIIFNLALNTNLEFDDVRDNYPPYGVGKMEPIMGIASEQSGQGKTFLATMSSLTWGDRVMSADKFSDDNAQRLVKALRENGWGREMSGEEQLAIFRESRSGKKLPGETIGEFQRNMWNERCRSTGLLLVDLPGMKKVEGKATRPTNGFDALRWAIPTYVIPVGQKPISKEFDEVQAREVVEGFYKAIKETWHLDEQRLNGLRAVMNS